MKPQDFANLQKKLDRLLTEDEQLDELSPEVYKSAASKRRDQGNDLDKAIDTFIDQLELYGDPNNPVAVQLQKTIEKYQAAASIAWGRASSLDRHAAMQAVKQQPLPPSVSPKGRLGRMLK